MRVQLDAIWTYLSTQGVDFGLKILGALAVWLIGRWLIGVASTLLGKGLDRSGKVEPTLSKYLRSILSVVLNVMLVLAVLDIFGVKTTSFAALLAGAGLAIGTAWGGLLTHFAAGVFLQVLRPYRVGDQVKISGVEGTVSELGLFGTTIVTEDNASALVGNNKVLSDTILNFSTLASRRVDCTAKLEKEVDVDQAIARLKVAVAAIPNVLAEPAPSVEILQFTAEGPLLCVRPSTDNRHYWQVYFDTHKAIVAALNGKAYPVPEAALEGKLPPP
jgi:small conductance mechanosensitive channel